MAGSVDPTGSGGAVVVWPTNFAISAIAVPYVYSVICTGTSSFLCHQKLNFLSLICNSSLQARNFSIPSFQLHLDFLHRCFVFSDGKPVHRPLLQLKSTHDFLANVISQTRHLLNSTNSKVAVLLNLRDRK